MVGITSFSAYIPRYRMNRKTIFNAMGWFNGAAAMLARGEKAVANYDEDSLTMAVEAANHCLNGINRDEIDGLYLGSTTAPYVERQNAGICSNALAFRSDVRTADFSASLKSGSTALISACEAIGFGGMKKILVCASDSRLGKPGSTQEYTFGDGAAALLVGSSNVIAEFKGSYSLSKDLVEYRRTQEERFLHTWEERWARDEGYSKFIPDVVRGLLKKFDVKIQDFAKVIIGCPSSSMILGAAKKLGIEPDRIQDNMEAIVGDTGNALPLMMFVAALEKAKPGDKMLVISYGNGCDALYFEITEEINKLRKGNGIKDCIDNKEEFNSYEKYLVFRDLIPLEVGIRGEEIGLTRYSMLYREGKYMAALCGSKCIACGTPQYPAARVCMNPDCGAIDKREDYYFFDKVGHIKSYTGDNLSFSLDPPEKYGFIDFDDGGRLYLDITDCKLDDLRIGMKVKMSFRRKFVDRRRGVHAYFWKAVPLREQ